MSDLIKEFNEKIINYISECVKAGEMIDCHEESYLLNREKVITMYNQLVKEKNAEKDSQNYKEFLEELKNNCIEHIGYRLEDLPQSTEEIEEYTKNAILDYKTSKQEFVIRSYILGCALHLLKEKNKYKMWDENIQDFFKKNNFKLKRSAEHNLRKFYIDIGPYQKLLFTQKSYTELRRLLPKIHDAFALYPEEKNFWKAQLIFKNTM